MSTTAHLAPHAPDRPSPDGGTAEQPGHVRLGVGARFSLHPAADDVVPVVLGALEAARRSVPDVTVVTDDVSTLVRGDEQQIARFLTVAIASGAAATPSGHLSATVALSRGCPGEVACEPAAGELPAVAPVVLDDTVLPASAHWALYPLGPGDVMPVIARAVDAARANGTRVTPSTFVTRLDGDLSQVVGTLVDTWAATGRHVSHVTVHATISIGSPSAPSSRSTAGGVAR